jgi:hypothetical protein
MKTRFNLFRRAGVFSTENPAADKLIAYSQRNGYFYKDLPFSAELAGVKSLILQNKLQQRCSDNSQTSSHLL